MLPHVYRYTYTTPRTKEKLAQFHIRYGAKPRRYPIANFKRNGSRAYRPYGGGRNRGRKRKTYMEYKEIKFHDVDVDDATIAANGTIAKSSILTIAQGDTSVTRSGRQIFVKSILWRYQIQLPNATAAGGSSDSVRVIMYLDRQANRAAATVTNILASDNYLSFKNLHVGSRFGILYDKTHSLNSSISGDGTTVDTSVVNRDGRYFKEFKRHIPILYNSTVGALTEMEQKNIGVLLLSSAGLCQFLSKVRVRFHD